VGIIGAGWPGQQHARAVRASDRADLYGIAESDRERRSANRLTIKNLVFNPSAVETCIELSFEHRHYEKIHPSITCARGLCHDASDLLRHRGERTSRNDDHHHPYRISRDSLAAAHDDYAPRLRRGLLSQATSS
jgi:hypothetical protein